MSLYHKDVGWPAWFNPSLKGQVMLDYGFHAREEAISDRYGKIPLPSSLDLSQCQVIEIEAGNVGRVDKYVLRTPLDLDRDLVIVLRPTSSKVWFVKTVWVNKHDDKHRTLDVSRYAHPIPKRQATLPTGI